MQPGCLHPPPVESDESANCCPSHYTFSDDLEVLLTEASKISPEPQIRWMLYPFHEPAESAFNALYERDHLLGMIFLLTISVVLIPAAFFLRYLTDSTETWEPERGHDLFVAHMVLCITATFAAVVLYAWSGKCCSRPEWLKCIPRKAVFNFCATCCCFYANYLAIMFLYRDEEPDAQWAFMIGQLVGSYPFGCALLLGTPLWVCGLMHLLSFCVCAASPHITEFGAIAFFFMLLICWQALTYLVLKGRRELFLIQLKAIRMERESRASKVRADAQVKMVAAAAHDLQTPLAAIKSGCRVLAMQGLTENSNQVVTQMSAALSFCLSFVRGLGFGARALLDQGLRPAVTVVRVRELVTDIEGIARLACSGGDTADVKFQCTVDVGVHNRVRTDEEYLRRGLLNLLSNAFSATSKGSIDCVVALSHCPKEADQLQFRVIDTGSGIDLSLEDRYFEPFVSSRGSMGLGLFVLDQQSKALGGSCGLRPNKDSEGCEAWFQVKYDPIVDVSDFHQFPVRTVDKSQHDELSFRPSLCSNAMATRQSDHNPEEKQLQE